MVGLCCCVRAFSGCGEQGLCLVAVGRLLIAVGSFAARHGLEALRTAVVARRISCSAACGIFLDRGWNQCPSRGKVDF